MKNYQKKPYLADLLEEDRKLIESYNVDKAHHAVEKAVEDLKRWNEEHGWKPIDEAERCLVSSPFGTMPCSVICRPTSQENEPKMSDKFEKQKRSKAMANKIEDVQGVCFQIVYKNGCEGVFIDKSHDNVVLQSMWLEDIVFGSEAQALACFEDPYDVTLYVEEEFCGVDYPMNYAVTVTFNDRLGLYEITDTEGNFAMLKLVPKHITLWSD